MKWIWCLVITATMSRALCDNRPDALNVIIGRPTDHSVVLSVMPASDGEAKIEYRLDSDANYTISGPLPQRIGVPCEFALQFLTPNEGYAYRVLARSRADQQFEEVQRGHFHTQRAPGASFTFAVQGDSHPEREGKMFDPSLYARTLQQAAGDRPDFYFCMGDDFSIDTLRPITAMGVEERYTLQRPFLGLVAHSAALFLVNGNHEQASLYNFNQKGIAHDASVWAQTSRNRYFPMPAPDGFYGGDEQEHPGIGPLRDYYSWTWGDALFVVVDNYWHSPSLVDNPLGEKSVDNVSNKRTRDWWAITVGDTQYNWLARTLAQSTAKYKFVFAHHVLGTGRGGTDEADLYEWGGRSQRGDDEFREHRPNWGLPIHQLMVQHGVSAFFHGHDHLYARQEREDVIYQQVPLPADARYSLFNDNRYADGTKLANSGYLRVTVSAEGTKVEYIRCYLPVDEDAHRRTGEVAHSYTLRSRAPRQLTR